MMYEIAREIFKQRVGKKHNFAIMDLSSEGDFGKNELKGSENLPYSDSFLSQFKGKYPDKNQNVLLYSLVEGDNNPIDAAKALQDDGYNFVYFYRGNPEDVILDKGLN